MQPYVIIGAGLAGSECALTLASRGQRVKLIEQKPLYHSKAHASDNFCELVCSNSFRSNERTSAVGLLKEEMRDLGSFFMKTADMFAVPAGKALAVDREKFSQEITRQIASDPLIEIISARIDSLGDPLLQDAQAVIIAAGPLASEELTQEIAALTEAENCHFYDAIAPIVWTDSLDKNIVFRASRYDEGDNLAGDYLNCPFTREEYEEFYKELVRGEVYRGHAGESETHFEGCMPIEALAARGPRTLTFGPMKPVGLIDPRTGKRPWAVVQLRAEQANVETCNLVGFQTKLRQGEQERIFRMIPGLKRAEFVRYGSMHRNTFVNAPEVLNNDLSFRKNRHIYLVGQLTGVEGYVESAATGLWLGLHLAAHETRPLSPLPRTTALGALLMHLQRPGKNFQPSNITFGLMPELEGKTRKKDRKTLYSERAQCDFSSWLKENDSWRISNP